MSGFPTRNNKTQTNSLGSTFIQPKCGGKLGVSQLPAKGSDKGTEYSWKHRANPYSVGIIYVPQVHNSLGHVS